MSSATHRTGSTRSASWSTFVHARSGTPCVVALTAGHPEVDGPLRVPSDTRSDHCGARWTADPDSWRSRAMHARCAAKGHRADEIAAFALLDQSKFPRNPTPSDHICRANTDLTH